MIVPTRGVNHNDSAHQGGSIIMIVPTRGVNHNDSAHQGGSIIMIVPTRGSIIIIVPHQRVIMIMPTRGVNHKMPTIFSITSFAMTLLCTRFRMEKGFMCVLVYGDVKLKKIGCLLFGY